MDIRTQKLLNAGSPSPRASTGRVLLIALASVITLTACTGEYDAVSNLDSTGSTIVFFGNSITAGCGLPQNEAFPALIGRQLGVSILNAGVEGDTTVEAIARLEDDVLNRDPRVVVVEFGGNDFRRNMDREQTFRNLDRVVERVTEEGAMVVLLELRIGILRDEYLSGYRRVAKAHGALLISDFMSGILGNSKLTVDGVHPNAAGHRLIAERVMQKLAPLLDTADRHPAGKR